MTSNRGAMAEAPLRSAIQMPGWLRVQERPMGGRSAQDRNAPRQVRVTTFSTEPDVGLTLGVETGPKRASLRHTKAPTPGREGIGDLTLASAARPVHPGDRRGTHGGPARDDLGLRG